MKQKKLLKCLVRKQLHPNDYAEFDSKISYIMFLHDYFLACEIATVRTLTLRFGLLKF